jgi:hypothetical protein
MPWIKTLIDPANPWGNLASILGLIVSVIGFIITIRSITTAKKAAEQASAAAEQAKAKVLLQGALGSFSSAIEVMEDIKRLLRKGDWEIAIERHSHLRRLLVDLKSASPGINDKEKLDIQSAIEQFKDIEKQVEKAINAKHTKTLPKLNVSKLNGIATEQIIKIQEIATILRNH